MIRLERGAQLGGRYRHRRYATFAISTDAGVRKAHQPRYQCRDYNPLNGGIERWFEPVTEAVAAHPITLALLDASRKAFDALTKPARHRVERCTSRPVTVDENPRVIAGEWGRSWFWQQKGA
jgi:hypothetical protein